MHLRSDLLLFLNCYMFFVPFVIAASISLMYRSSHRVLILLSKFYFEFCFALSVKVAEGFLSKEMIWPDFHYKMITLPEQMRRSKILKEGKKWWWLRLVVAVKREKFGCVGSPGLNDGGWEREGERDVERLFWLEHVLCWRTLGRVLTGMGTGKVRVGRAETGTLL